MQAAIIDGYVDEPAVLGVPPYLSHYVRYAAAGYKILNYDVKYFTIDKIRKENLWNAFDDYDEILIIGGLTVPGHYLSGTPITPFEVKKIFSLNSHPYRVIFGSIARAYSMKGGSLAKKIDIEVDEIVDDLSKYFLKDMNCKNLSKIAHFGSFIVKDHPFFPHIICEIEVSVGCERKSHCSFCTEPILHPVFKSRKITEIITEIETLYKEGIKAFRLGRTANIIAYGADWNKNKINPSAIKELYEGIREKAPHLEVLHADNANPAYIARNKKESIKILQTIVKNNTSGDILSFGIESFDPIVRRKNNLDGTLEEIEEAVRIVNEIGSKRDENNIPHLLPGINLIYGLIGERSETYEINYKTLLQYLEKGYLIRRINLRQILIFPHTPLWKYTLTKKVKINKKKFKHYKYLIRQNIDLPMIKKVFPIGCIIRKVIPEIRKGKITFGRPLGTYPPLIGIMAKVDNPCDVVIVNHGPRSLTGIRKGINIEEITIEELASIDGISKNIAQKIKFEKDFSFLNESIKKLMYKILI